MIWEMPRLPKEAVDDFCQRFQIDPLVGAVLLRRNIEKPEELRFFLDEDLKSTHSPFLFMEMEDAVDRVLQARAEGEKVLIFGDRDVDGITSTALLTQRLRDFGLDVKWQLPMGDESYGLTEEVITGFAGEDGSLLITVDCGITSAREIDLARDLGIDTIVIDHHNPQDDIPMAVALINPKLDDAGYPFDGLCGAALVAKFLWALRFSQTSFYKQTFTLLNVRPGNESVIFEAIKMENMVEVDRLTENIVPGIGKPEQSRLVDFLVGHEILVYDAKPQERLMRQVFGDRVDISLTDIAPEIAKTFPSLQGRSLMRMLQGSRLARFSHRPPLEIEALMQLMVSFMYHAYPALFEEYKRDLDLVALGLVADMMPMRDENRILVRHGLESLSTTPRQGLRELLQYTKVYGKPISSKDIGWKIGPIINSTGRMGRPDRAVELLLSDNRSSQEVTQLLREVVSMNAERKELGSAAWQKVYPLAKESFEQFGRRFLIVRDDSVHRGITGILAGRLCREFNAPAAVVAQLDTRLVGSIRSMRGFRATEFLSRFEDLFETWGGHDAAGGFSLGIDSYSVFLQRITEVLPFMHLEEQTEEVLAVDLMVPPVRMDEGLEAVEKILAPHGQEFPRLTYSFHGARIEDIQFLGKTQEHVKLTLQMGPRKWPALYWNASDLVGSVLQKNAVADVAFHLERNYYGQSQNLQLQIVDLKNPDAR